MSDTTTLGPYLRRERERRGMTLRTISESTKVSVALLEGLEADDVSRWPGGIFRRAFVRSYAQCVGLDPDEVVKKFEQQHQPAEPQAPLANAVAAPPAQPASPAPGQPAPVVQAQAWPATPSRRARLQGTAADLTMAAILAFASAAAGSRLLWPVLLIAAYYATGIMLTGTSPMVALLSDQPQGASASGSGHAVESQSAAPQNRTNGERRHGSRRHERQRHRRNLHARAN
jgi:hypothetical protein